MNWLLVLVFAGAAFYFLVEDSLFLAVLCLVGLVLALYYYSTVSDEDAGAKAKTSVASEGDGAPLIVKVGGKKKHESSHLYKVRVYPTWENRSMWEEFGKNFLGPILHVFGSTAYRAATGKHAEKGWDIQPEEQFRGR
ncbi:MAG: hypothetical protein QW343_02065 [Candidatus Norongarragalinales archaeon]